MRSTQPAGPGKGRQIGGTESADGPGTEDHSDAVPHRGNRRLATARATIALGPKAAGRPSHGTDADPPLARNCAVPSRPNPSAPQQPRRPATGRSLICSARPQENRTVQAALHNVQSLKFRLPQVTAPRHPVASNVVFPIPSVAPQYSLMGYNPYNLTLAQQFPWFGTLRLRGKVAERDVQVALAELAAAQLDSVATVKRAYCNLFAATRADEVLAENRKILEDFRSIALAPAERRVPARRASRRALDQRARPRAGRQPAVDRGRTRIARTSDSCPARHGASNLAGPSSGIGSQGARPAQLAGAGNSAELQGRLAAIVPDEQAVELAKKRATRTSPSA